MRHHFVPQFLLRGWADATSDKKVEEYRLDLIDTSFTSVPSTRRAPKHTAYQEDLYALSKPVVAGMEKQALEIQYLRIVDNDAAVVRAKLLNNGLMSLTKNDREAWARFLMSLRLRVPEIVTKHRLESEAELKKVLASDAAQYQELAGTDDPPTMVEWVEKHFPGLIANFGMTFLQETMDNPKIGAHILRMKWWLWDFTKGKHELLLADRPCIFTRGLSDQNTIIALPISHNVAFMATQSDVAADSLRRQTPTRLAVLLNESTVSNAHARVYGRDRQAQEFILNRMHRRKE